MIKEKNRILYCNLSRFRKFYQIQRRLVTSKKKIVFNRNVKQQNQEDVIHRDVRRN